MMVVRQGCNPPHLDHCSYPATMKTLIDSRACAWCGKDFAPVKNRFARFCSKSCANCSSRSAKRDALREVPKPCAFCKKPFVVTAKQGGQIYCSPDCMLMRDRVRQKAWRDNPDNRQTQRLIWNKASAARRQDSGKKLLANMRSRLSYALQGRQKPVVTMQLLGCDRSTLLAHLEARFAPGMTWDNYGHGGWHVDHIVPCASFDLTDPEQQRACFHYTNLQPLWASDNCSKGARLDWETTEGAAA